MPHHRDTPTRRRPNEAAGTGTDRDHGFTLLEAVVAMALFAVLAGSALAILGTAVGTTRYETYRAAAMNLAARETSIVADTFNSTGQGPEAVALNQVVNPHPLGGGSAGDPLVVDNVPYTVTRTAQWASVGSAAASACDEGTSSELAYLKVRVEVTWPQQRGRTSSVVMQSMLTPKKGTYSDVKGHVGVRVIDAAGKPRAGEVVTLQGPDGTETTSTATDGCALFAFLSAGTYTVTLNRTGYVNRSGDPTARSTAQVQPGQLVRTVIEYDQAASIAMTFRTLDGYGLPNPNGVPVSLGNSAIQPLGSAIRTGSGNSRTIANLWPYPSGYQLWAGSCVDNDPQFTGEDRELPVAVTGGVTSTATVELAPIEARSNRGGTKTMVAVHAVAGDTPEKPGTDNGCPSGLRVTLGTITGAGSIKTSIPFGRWRIYDGTGWSDPFEVRKGGAPVTAVTK